MKTMNLKTMFGNIKLKTKDYYNKNMILVNILNLYFWKSWLGPILTFIVVPIYSIILLAANSNYGSTIMPSIVSNPLIFIPLWFVISSSYELKKNSIVEKIFIFSKKPIYSNVLIVLFYFVVVFIGFWWNLFIVYLMTLNKDLFKYNLFQSIDWGAIIFIMLLAIFLALSISSMIYTYIQSFIKAQLVGYIVSIFLMVFSGAFFSVATASKAIIYISYFSAYKYINSMFVIAMNAGTSMNNLYNTSIFDLSKDFAISNITVDGNNLISNGEIILYHSYDMYLNIFVPLILTIVLYSFSLNKRMCIKK